MPHATVRLDNTVIELSPRLESIIRVLVQYQQAICYPDTCVVELHCGHASTHGRSSPVRARLVVPLDQTSLKP